MGPTQNEQTKQTVSPHTEISSIAAEMKDSKKKVTQHVVLDSFLDAKQEHVRTLHQVIFTLGKI